MLTIFFSFNPCLRNDQLNSYTFHICLCLCAGEQVAYRRALVLGNKHIDVNITELSSLAWLLMVWKSRAVRANGRSSPGGASVNAFRRDSRGSSLHILFQTRSCSLKAMEARTAPFIWYLEFGLQMKVPLLSQCLLWPIRTEHVQHPV